MHRILEDPAVAEYEALLGHAVVKRVAQVELERVRSDPSLDVGAILASVLAGLADKCRRDVVPVINATGIVAHTNLGRAPLAREAIAAIDRIASGYCNLEYDLAGGGRGSRYDRVVSILRDVTGARDGLIVNNCAAAVLLILDTFAKGREAIVARGELIEIGGGFRVPDVLARTGAVLREVGTTNRTYAADFERALSARTAVLLRVDPSNYRVEGFTAQPSGSDLARLAHGAGAILVEDLGSGAIVDLAEYGLPHARTVGEALAEGIDLVAFSGDKLLGGPQAGIVVGRPHLIARLRSNPLLRALRVDKLTVAALEATLDLHRNPQSRRNIPLYRMLAATPVELRRRAARYAEAVPGCTIVSSDAFAGGGALPQSRIESVALELRGSAVCSADRIAAALRRQTPPIVARIANECVMLDLRTIAPHEDAAVIDSLERVFVRKPA